MFIVDYPSIWYLFIFIPLTPRDLKSAMGMYPYMCRIHRELLAPEVHWIQVLCQDGTAAASPGFHCWITILFFKRVYIFPSCDWFIGGCVFSFWIPARNPVMVLGGPFCGLNPPFFAVTRRKDSEVTAGAGRGLTNMVVFNIQQININSNGKLPCLIEK